MDTCLIQIHTFYGQFALSMGKESPYKFFYLQPTEYGHPVNTDTFYDPLSVLVNGM